MDAELSFLYGRAADAQKLRYATLGDRFTKKFHAQPAYFFSAPGRTEIIGNHTDHQRGCVVAASVDLDIIAAVSPADDLTVTMESDGFEPIHVNLRQLVPDDREAGTPSALIRGVAAAFTQKGYAIGGFRACTTSDVLKGSGLSSSAAFEILVATIFNHLYNSGVISAVEAALAGQYAENVFFQKPSGLMDQLACSVGGTVFIDFSRTGHPLVRQAPFDFARCQHALCVIDSGADHADLTAEYAAIPAEMRAVAAWLGHEVLSEVPENDFLAQLARIRSEVGDRAVLRAFHYYEENKRSKAALSALERDDFREFLRLSRESGLSSCIYLQNVTPSGAVRHQNMAFVLALCEGVLGDKGSFRIQGGGFAGTVQAFVPLDVLDGFKTRCEEVLGQGSCRVLSIRALGGVRVHLRKELV